MGYLIKQSSTSYELLFLMVSNADHITGLTGLTPTVTIRKAGGSFGAVAGAVSEVSNGWYKVAGNATDTGTLGPLLLHASSTGADPVDDRYEVVAFDPQDSVRIGLTALPNAAAAASGGLPVLGTNATAISFTGGMTISNASGDALAVSSSGGNGNGMNVSGNGSGQGIKATGGATGRGIHALGGATSGSGFRAEGQGAAAMGIHAIGGSAAPGMEMDGGATGAGLKIVGGATSGDGIDITTTSGDGISILPTAGNAITATGNGTSKHGLFLTGGTAGTSDGLKAVAGTGGVPIRGDLTGNITGNLSGSAGSVTGAVGSVTGAVGSVTGSVGGNVVGTVASVVGAVGSVTGNVGGNVVGTVASVVGAVGSVTGNVDGNVTGSVGSVVGAVGSVTGAVGSVTGNVGGNVVGSVASVTAAVLVSSGTGSGQLDFTAGVVKANATQILGTAVSTPATAGILDVNLKNIANAAVSTSTAQIGVNAVQIGASVPGSATIGTVTNLTNAAGAGDFTSTMKTSLNASTPASIQGAVASVTGNVGGNVTGTVASVVGNVGGNVTGSIGSLGSTAKTDVENAAWNATLSSHLTAGSTGAALNAAGAAGDPWSTAIPGAYGAGTAGKIVGDNINATISSRLASASYAAPDNSSIAAIKAKTDNLPASPAATGDIPSASTNASAVWDADRSSHVTAGSFGQGVASVQGAVTGAVGSVAGNVGGNVIGSTSSVSGAVGSVTGNIGGNVVGSVGSVIGSIGGSVASVTAPVSITAGQLFIKKNAALSNFEFLMTDSATHAPVTGLTVTAKRSIDGAAFATCANVVSEVSSGVYKLNLAAADLNGTIIMLYFSATGADDCFIEIVTQA